MCFSKTALFLNSWTSTMSVAHPHYFLQPASQAVCLVKAKSIKVWGFSMTGALTILVPFLTKMYILSVLYSIAILLSRRSVVLGQGANTCHWISDFCEVAFFHTDSLRCLAVFLSEVSCPQIQPVFASMHFIRRKPHDSDWYSKADREEKPSLYVINKYKHIYFSIILLPW